jgi:hypothetical protein
MTEPRDPQESMPEGEDLPEASDAESPAGSLTAPEADGDEDGGV